MIEIQGMKTVAALQPETLSNGSGTAVEIDTQGYQHLKVFIVTGTMAASSNISVCKLQQSDTSGSGFADVSGAALASGDLDAGTDDAVAAIEVDLRGGVYERYFQLVVTESGTANAPVAAIAVLSRPNPIQVPNTATLRGLTAEVSV